MEQEEKKRSKREDENENPRRNDEGGGGDGMPRFSFTWIYVLVGLALLGLQMSKMMGASRKADWSDFDRWAHKNQIDRLVVVNNEEAYIYIQKDSLGFGEHKDIKSEPNKFNADQPHYIMNIGKPEVMEPKLAKLNEALLKEKKLPIIAEYDPRTNWTDRKSVV